MPIIKELSNEAYHGHPAISKSGLDALSRSPAHYQAYKAGYREETPALMRGTLIHTAILEPEYIDSRYFAMTEKVERRTKEGKARFAEFEAEANGRAIVTLDDMTMAKRIRDEIIKHPIASHLFDGGESETSIFSQINGVDVRCRPDYLNGSICIDVKSTDDASELGFIRSIEKYRYAVQAALYSDIANQEGLEIFKFVFVAVEKNEPYAIGIYELDDESIECGRKEYLANLDTYKRCLESGNWPAYDTNIKKLSLSNYAMQRSERRIELSA